MKKIIQFEEEELSAFLRSLYKDETGEVYENELYEARGSNAIIDMLITKWNLT